MAKLNKQAIRELLHQRFEKDCYTKLSLIPKPFLFKDIEKAANRIRKAMENREKIAIVGDYDVDGVVSSVILSEFFDDFDTKYDLQIPNRFSDGYGLNPQILDRINANVIITVDNGISAIEAAKICKQRGIDLIVTDHHTPPPSLPEAFAIINPKQNDCNFPSKEICGAQVAWYLVAAMKEICGFEYNLGKFLDLLSVAIVADMMDLKDINRTFVKSGLKLLNTSERPAFMAIKEVFRKVCFDSDDISFLISPLLNSSGRMEDALFSYGFLRSSSKREAILRLEEIMTINERRKDEERTLFEATIGFVNEEDSVIVIWGEEWHEGVIGIVASRLVKRFKKPAIVFSKIGDRAKGSARSILGVDIFSLISKQKHLLLGFGGHFSAAGVLIESQNLEKFKQGIIESAKEIEIDVTKCIEDNFGEIEPEEIDFELLEILEHYEPYGQKNPKPSFILKDMYIKTDKSIGKDNQHKKLILQYGEGKNIEALFFNYHQDTKVGDMVDIAFYISKNNFRGLITPQLLIKEILKIN